MSFDSELAPVSEVPRMPVNWRSILLGLAGTIGICAFTPYNDYALNNTFLVGNNLPLGVIMLLFLFVVCINWPLHRLKSRLGMSSGELTVALSMTLASCCLPSSGLMRYFPESLVAPFYHAQNDADDQQVLQALHLKSWIFPTFKHGTGPMDWMGDRLVYGFMNGLGPARYRAWLTPFFTWGIFLFALYGALMFMVAMTRRQWLDNERLAFPLAQIYLSLVEQPEKKSGLAPTLRKKAFWLAFAIIFLLHFWNGLASYRPQAFPTIPVAYNLTDLFKERPWEYAEFYVKYAKVYFSAVGVTYFLTNSVSFSLWAFVIAEQIWRMAQGTLTGEPANYGRLDQHFGGVMAFFLSVLWVGRQHWKLVLSQALRGVRKDEPRGRYCSYRVSFWGFIICTAIMIAWLHLAGGSVGGAIVMVLLLLTLFFVITRIIAETGLIHGQLHVPINKPFNLMVLAGWKTPVSVNTYYLSSMLDSVHYDFREVLPVYVSHAMKVADQTIFGLRRQRDDGTEDRRTGRRLVGVILLSLVVGYAVSGFSTLWTMYNHETTLDVRATSPINSWGMINSKWLILNATGTYIRNDFQPRANPAVHISIGFAVTSFLVFMRWRYTWWPLHPIGYIMLGTFPAEMLWFSIFWGWLAKTLILRFGGPKMYLNAKPFFLGLIVGESMAAGLWLAVGIVCHAMGIPYRPIQIMPG